MIFLKKGMFDNAKSGVQHNIPFTTNFKLFKHFSVSVGGRYTKKHGLEKQLNIMILMNQIGVC